MLQNGSLHWRKICRGRVPKKNNRLFETNEYFDFSNTDAVCRVNIHAALSNKSNADWPFNCIIKVIWIFSTKVIFVGMVRQAQSTRFLRMKRPVNTLNTALLFMLNFCICFILCFLCFWLIEWSNQNQIFYYTRCITPKRVTGLRDTSPHHCARETQLFSRKCWRNSEALATMCPIWPAQDFK